MVLTPRIAIRINALRELKNRQHLNKNAVGAELSSYLIQHIAYDKGRDFPKWMDISQRELIITEVIPTYFDHLRDFTQEDINYFSEYRQKQGPYFIDMAERAIPFTETISSRKIEMARQNMISLNHENYPEINLRWENLK